MSRITKPYVFLLLLLACFQAMAQAELTTQERHQMQHLFSLIDQRFQLIKEVAAYKYAKQIPLFFPGREQQLLADIKKVSDSHALDLQSVQTFISLLFRTNVELQNQWHKHWLRNGFPEDMAKKDLYGELRPDLSILTHEVVSGIAKSLPILNRPGVYEELKPMFKEAINVEWLTDEQRDKILLAMTQIKKNT